MKCRLLTCAAILLLQTWAIARGGDAIAQTPASAPVPAASPASDTVAAPSERHTWYGWQTLTTDAGSFALMGGAFALPGRRETQDLAKAMFVGALGAYALGAPLVHLANGQPWRAAASLGLRIGVPTLSFFAVAAAADCHTPWCKLNAAGVGGLVAMVAVSLVDAAAIAHRYERVSPKAGTVGLLVSPQIDPTSGTYGVSLGASGF